jgi:hypothetical protein
MTKLKIRNKITKSDIGKPISLYLMPENLKKLDLMAESEKRSRSDMANLIISGDYTIKP